jgi:hypothetical protein
VQGLVVVLGDLAVVALALQVAQRVEEELPLLLQLGPFTHFA